MTEDQMNALKGVLPYIREFKQTLEAQDMGALIELKILFIGDAEPTTIKYSTVSKEDFEKR